jgi:site-specific DNA-methyltransferase (adenine-specific)
MQNWHLGWLQACFDILPSGGLLKVFGATRTFHRLAAAMEEAGFLLPPEHSLEAWGYGSGFPKYLNTSKAIDAHLGKTAERKVTGVKPDEGFTDGKMSRVQSLATGAVGGEDGFARPWMNNPAAVARYHQQTAAASPEAAKFDGWATALKPGWEPFVVGIKP